MEDLDLVSKYFKEYVRRGFWKIFNEQRRIANAKIYSHTAYRLDGSLRSRSGRLQQALENPDFRIVASGGRLDASYSYPAYMRFLDMRRLRNYRIYNRPVWGILYRETFRDIRYEFADWLQKRIKDNIRQSYQQSK